MNTYELTYVFPSDITSEQAQAKAGELEAAIQQKSGVIVQKTTPQAKPLSYPVRKFSSGYVGTLEFQLDPAALADLEKGIKADKAILRSMLLNKRPVKVKKEKRSKLKALFSFGGGEKKAEVPAQEAASAPAESMPPAAAKPEAKPKVELKDIEQELDKILGE